MNSVVNSFALKQCVKSYKIVIVLLLNLAVFACQNIQELPSNIITINTENFGQYYLKLKTLSADELKKEIEQQQVKKQQGNIAAGVRLILLHSLPNSVIHNAYSAKSQLNEQLKAYQNHPLSKVDQAFIYLLKDQLNQQLFLFQKLINQELAYDAKVAEHKMSNKTQQNKMSALKLTVTQLTQQITQLKKIEQTISEHGQ